MSLQAFVVENFAQYFIVEDCGEGPPCTMFSSREAFSDDVVIQFLAHLRQQGRPARLKAEKSAEKRAEEKGEEFYLCYDAVCGVGCWLF